MRKYITAIIILLIGLAGTILIYRQIAYVEVDGTISWKVKERETRSRLLAVPILLYHNIDGAGPFSIDLTVLRSQFDLIKKRKIRVIPLRELIEHLENPRPFEEKVIVLTFDDGYPSMYDKLLPLAQEYNFPITLFVYTDFIYTRGTRVLTWKKLREMDQSLIDIQCHTRRHPDLTLLTARDDLEARQLLYEEIYLSKRVMELYLNKRINYFAFPFGRYDLKILALSHDSGYGRVFSTDYGSNVITRDNYSLRRHHIKRNYSLAYFDSLIQQVR